MATTYHLVQRQVWEGSDPARPYAPPSLADEGFVHCTDGADELAATANRYYGEESDELLALVIDPARLSAAVRYDDPRRVYPHVFGPIDRAAIVAVLPMARDAAGAFLPPAH